MNSKNFLYIDPAPAHQLAAFFGQSASSYAVMKDGSRVEIMNKKFVKPIDLNQVDHILLADGTKLTVPQA